MKNLYLFGILPFIVLTSWGNLLEPIEDLAYNLVGNPLVMGAIIFIFITFFSLLLFIPFEAMVVIWVPTSFLMMIFIPVLRLVLGVLLGLLIGIGLLKWLRR